MINRLRIENYKCFSDVDIHLSDLNVLTGENSSGKSSVIQALLLYYQIGEDKRGNLLNGRYVELGQYNEVANYYTRDSILISVKDEIDETQTNIISNTAQITFGEFRKKDIVYLSADRIGVQKEYKQNELGVDRIGIHCEYAFDYFSREKQERLKEESFIWDISYGASFANQVNAWLEYLTGYRVKAELVEGTSVVKVSYIGKGNSKEFRTCHVGTGVSYLANVIIAALSCTKGSLLIVENPEIHLHPKAQSKFIKFFSFLASRGLQIIIETHSDHIINGVRKEIKKKQINTEQVNVYFMKKEDQMSEAVKIRINEKGSIVNPEKGFFDQFDDDLDILLGFDEYE